MKPLLFLLALGLPLPAVGAELAVTLSGTAYEGGAAFAVALSGTTVGKGVVDPATDPKLGKTFDFQVDDALLAKNGDLTVVLTNDLFVAGKGDRNLLIVGAKLGTTSLDAGDFVIAPSVKGAEEPGLIATADQVATGRAPASGWLPMPKCIGEAAVVGFANGVVELTAAQKLALAPLVKQAIADQCSATVVGYSSVTGTKLGNNWASRARADMVASYLKSQKLAVAPADITSFGATAQFGPTPGDNRRVVVKLKEKS